MSNPPLLRCASCVHAIIDGRCRCSHPRDEDWQPIPRGSIWRIWRRILGYRDCPCCGARALIWHKVAVYHEDEPPMFGWWHCEACDRATEVLPTKLTEHAVKGLGYRSFDEYAQAIEAGTAETGTGSVHESAVGNADAPKGGQP